MFSFSENVEYSAHESDCIPAKASFRSPEIKVSIEFLIILFLIQKP